MDKVPGQSHDDFESFIATLDRLKALALRGNEQAIAFLWKVGMKGALALADIAADGSPEVKQALQRLASERLGWPIVATYLDGPEEIQRQMLDVRLSAALPYDTRSQAKKEPMTLLAYYVIGRIQDAGDAWKARRTGGEPARRLPMYARSAAALPPFTRQALPRWWKVASKVFDRELPDPATIPWMRAMVGNGASASTVRTIVKRRLRQKLGGLARKN